MISTIVKAEWVESRVIPDTRYLRITVLDDYETKRFINLSPIAIVSWEIFTSFCYVDDDLVGIENCILPIKLKPVIFQRKKFITAVMDVNAMYRCLSTMAQRYISALS